MAQTAAVCPSELAWRSSRKRARTSEYIDQVAEKALTFVFGSDRGAADKASFISNCGPTYFGSKAIVAAGAADLLAVTLVLKLLLDI